LLPLGNELFEKNVRFLIAASRIYRVVGRSLRRRVAGAESRRRHAARPAPVAARLGRRPRSA
jgi:hypothetical protein